MYMLYMSVLGHLLIYLFILPVYLQASAHLIYFIEAGNMLLEQRLQLVIFFLRVHIQYTYSSSEYYSVYSDFYFS
jgi:hypothetical protein